MCLRPVYACLIALVAMCYAPAHALALTAAEYDTALASIDAFLDRQMDRFAPVPGDYPAAYADAQLIQSYDVLVTDPGFIELYHRADVYDTALASIYYMRRGNLDRARRLLDGMRFVQEIEPIKDPTNPTIGDGRMRTSYWANDLLAPNRVSPSIDTPNAAIGDIAWAGIALTNYYKITGEQPYLDAAKRAADWIIDHTLENDNDGFGGFSLGRDHNDNPILASTAIRSTEHNIDTFVLAKNLHALDPDPKWADMAAHAKSFVELMYNDQPGQLYFHTGTAPDTLGNAQLNPSPIPTDAQTWSALAGIDTPQHHADALRWIADSVDNAPNSLKVRDDFIDGRSYHGLRFSTAGGHLQVEVTGGYALALQTGIQQGWLVPGPGDDPQYWHDELQHIIDNFEAIRTTADGKDPGGIGFVATPWPQGAPTGYGTTYPDIRHVASNVWVGLAMLAAHPDPDTRDPHANPLAPLSPRLAGDLNADGFVGLDDLDIVLNNWNTTVPAGDLTQGDPTGDGFVGLDDLDIVLNNWNAGTPPAPASIPEPASLGLFALLSIGLASRRCRSS